MRTLLGLISDVQAALIAKGDCNEKECEVVVAIDLLNTSVGNLQEGNKISDRIDNASVRQLKEVIRCTQTDRMTMATLLNEATEMLKQSSELASKYFRQNVESFSGRLLMAKTPAEVTAVIKQQQSEMVNPFFPKDLDDNVMILLASAIKKIADENLTDHYPDLFKKDSDDQN